MCIRHFFFGWGGEINEEWNEADDRMISCVLSPEHGWLLSRGLSADLFSLDQVNTHTNKLDVKPCDSKNELQLWICKDYPQYGK